MWKGRMFTVISVLTVVGPFVLTIARPSSFFIYYQTMVASEDASVKLQDASNFSDSVEEIIFEKKINFPPKNILFEKLII